MAHPCVGCPEGEVFQDDRGNCLEEENCCSLAAWRRLKAIVLEEEREDLVRDFGEDLGVM